MGSACADERFRAYASARLYVVIFVEGAFRRRFGYMYGGREPRTFGTQERALRHVLAM